MDDLERSAELLSMTTPFQPILAYLKKAGVRSLEAIPLGRRSGKQSDLDGLIIFYREKGNPEGIQMIYYDYKTGRFAYHNDTSWVFRKIESKEDEPLFLPIKGFECFRLFNLIDNKARQEVLTAINASLDVEMARKVKSKHQRKLTNELLTAFNAGKVSKEQALQVYQILYRENLVAWDDEFSEIMDEYRRTQGIGSLITSLEEIFQKYRIDLREKRRPRALEPQDLEVITYMFLSQKDFKGVRLEL